MSNEFAATARTTVRKSERASYDRDVIYSILDEALICHVGFVAGDHPFVVPTIHARVDDKLYLHGSPATRMLKVMRTGIPVCVTATLLDGLILARSAFHHSMNYRSVVVTGHAAEVEDAEEKLASLSALVEHVVPGRWRDCRRPTLKEFAKTQILAVPITEASAKLRTGPPVDEDEDLGLDIWAGEIPLRLQALPPVDDPDLRRGVIRPEYVSGYRRGSG
jgi:nitroimidazol reductase NimA-like FMN-containing flavoprotein (pyridoxamine 5'-phosphate oxidase superfamily)